MKTLLIATTLLLSGCVGRYMNRLSDEVYSCAADEAPKIVYNAIGLPTHAVCVKIAEAKK